MDETEEGFLRLVLCAGIVRAGRFFDREKPATEPGGEVAEGGGDDIGSQKPRKWYECWICWAAGLFNGEASWTKIT